MAGSGTVTPVPGAPATLLTIGEYASDSYMGSTGTVPSNAVQVAIDIASGHISDALGYPIDGGDGSLTFIETTWIEEQPTQWPPRPGQLSIPRIIDLTSVTALHELGCECEWTELDGCAFVYDARQSIIQWRAFGSLTGCYSACRCPQRIRYVYTAGFTAAQVDAATPLGRNLRLAIALEARTFMNLQDHDTDGDVTVESYSSLGYSEKRAFTRTARGRRLGLGLLSQHAADLIAPYVTKAAIMIRSQ